MYANVPGLLFPAAIRLSMMMFARPIVSHASSSPPPPCSRYKTGYFWLLVSYPGGVYTIMRRLASFSVGEEYHTPWTVPCGTSLKSHHADSAPEIIRRLS